MFMRFKGKTVLVTGSSRGLGKRIIEEFAKEGSNIVINYTSSEIDALYLLEKVTTNYGVSGLCIKCDVSKEDEVKEMISKIVREFGRIDILVNNAGICNDSLFDEKTYDDFMKVLGVNLIGTYLVSKHVGKIMLNQEFGKIVNISSDCGLDFGYPESAEYDASKAGIISLTHNMAKFYAPFVNVNCVCPGWILTDMNKELDENQRKEIADKILLKRFANTDEIAKVVLFLASDDASYVNDAVIKVNGGSL